MIVGVLGLGYVGLPLCREFVQGGVEVIGFDVDEDKIQQLNNNKSYIKHISDEINESFRSLQIPIRVLVARVIKVYLLLVWIICLG